MNMMKVLNNGGFGEAKKGLRKLSEEIKLYTLNPSNEGISEHIHLGPYNYLKIMTWNEPMITITI